MRSATNGPVRGLGRAAPAAMVLALAACGASGPEPATVAMTIAATASINPNSASEPSPVVLRIYQLRSDRVFNTAEFSDIFYNDREVMGSDVLAQKEFELTPGGTLAYDDKVNLEARHIGVIAGFRNIESATWRVIEPVIPESENSLLLDVDSTSLSLRREQRRSRFWDRLKFR